MNTTSFKHIIQLSTALLKSSLMKLGSKNTTLGLTGIFKMQPTRIEHILKLKRVIWLDIN